MCLAVLVVLAAELEVDCQACRPRPRDQRLSCGVHALLPCSALYLLTGEMQLKLGARRFAKHEVFAGPASLKEAEQTCALCVLRKQSFALWHWCCLLWCCIAVAWRQFKNACAEGHALPVLLRALVILLENCAGSSAKETCVGSVHAGVVV